MKARRTTAFSFFLFGPSGGMVLAIHTYYECTPFLTFASRYMTMPAIDQDE